MGKKSLLMLFLAVSTGWLQPADGNPWGNLKKIYFYDAIADYGEVRRNLTEMDFTLVTRREKADLVRKVIQLGDHFFADRKFDMAGEVYQKILTVSPDAWAVYNRLEKIKHSSSVLFGFGSAWKQFLVLRRNFKSSFLLVNSFLNVLFFTWLLIFFLFIIFLFWKYFLLAVNDFLINRSFSFSLKKLVWISILLIWPVVFLGGWSIYPFLITGFLWVYLTAYEKNCTKMIIFILFLLSFGHAFNQYLEKSAVSGLFQIVQRVFAGDQIDEKLSRRFDDEMKVMQAFFYYEHNQSGMALDILSSVHPDYRSTLKFNLLGNIHFEAGDLRQSIQAYRESLSLDRRDEMILRNFLVALLKYDDPKLLATYQSTYAGLGDQQKNIQRLQVQRDFRFDGKFLWKRLLNFSEPRFPVVRFLQVLLLDFVRVPVLLWAVLMLLYSVILKKAFPFLGQSVYCSRCAKIIKKSYIDQSHILCDDCYQLFLIKDPIFYEAKVIKEREINRKFRLKYVGFLLVSFLIPGFYLNFRQKSKIFIFSTWFFFLMAGFSILASFLFRTYCGTAPLFLNFTGMAAFILYFFINLYAVKGDENGF